VYDGSTFPVSQPADWTMPLDPGHEFTDVLVQLCGSGAVYHPGGEYPPVNATGYVANYVTTGGGSAPGEIMKCYGGAQLPVLNALAREFALCDGWHASMPGPTWPNRFFMMAASSGGLDHSPSVEEIAKWMAIDGFGFEHGSLFGALTRAQKSWRLYHGDQGPVTGSLPVAGGLSGVRVWDAHPYSAFASDVAAASYPAQFTLIEPNYGDITADTYRGGQSQHSLDDVRAGETLIKSTYEALRKSPLWNTSLLIVTWDEHGGFYDHVEPPPAVAPGDAGPGSTYNKRGFTFERLGVRVPAVVISPWIPKNRIDHQTYDHPSIPATLQALFAIPALTNRDAAAHDVTSLLSLPAPRSDTPASLPDPVFPAAPPVAQALPPNGPVDSRSLPSFLHLAMRREVALSDPTAQPAIIARVQAIRTRGEAAQYIQQVQAKLRAAGQALA